MATSGTTTFDPTVAEFVDEAFERVDVDPATLTMRHLRSARRSLNLLFAEWAGEPGVKLWAIDQQTQTLSDGDPSYDCPAGTIAILEMVIRRSGSDTPVHPMSRDEYMGIARKTDEGLPSKFWFNRGRATQSFTLYQTPENSTDQAIYYRMRQLQDVGVPSNTLDVGQPWFEAVASGLAEKLSVKFKPEKFSLLHGLATKAFNTARINERERVDVQFSMGR